MIKINIAKKNDFYIFYFKNVGKLLKTTPIKTITPSKDKSSKGVIRDKKTTKISSKI